MVLSSGDPSCPTGGDLQSSHCTLGEAFEDLDWETEKGLEAVACDTEGFVPPKVMVRPRGPNREGGRSPGASPAVGGGLCSGGGSPWASPRAAQQGGEGLPGLHHGLLSHGGRLGP